MMDLLKLLVGAVIMFCAWCVYDSKENKEVGMLLLLLGAVIVGLIVI